VALAGRLVNGGFFYVYVLSSVAGASRHYTGWTEDLDKRLKAHNAGQCPPSARFRPWRVETAVALRSREKAVAFEKYLKSHSGRAFALRHFKRACPSYPGPALAPRINRVQQATAVQQTLNRAFETGSAPETPF